MKEIKFRAFFQVDKKIYEVLSIDFIEKEVMLFDVETSVNFETSLKYVELIQYTGLKDKNEVEIYEGDIIEYLALGNIIRKGEVIFDEDLASFGIFDSSNDFNLICECNDVNIIGNIYENPELSERR